jgi:DNA replication and repair protein RecF
MGEMGASELVYQPSVDGDADALAAALERHRANDVTRGRTSVGPHRDRLRLVRGGRELRTYGSAGQHRTAAIALRLCEAETLAQGGEPVVIGLDDAFAELDAERSRRLGELIERRAAAGSQVIAAVPQAGELPGGSGTALGALPRRFIAEGHVT